MNVSVALPTPIEFINLTPVNDLISKCQIKVCWVGPEANRNGSVITKGVAKEMANSLPGSPIVGYYDEAVQDFTGHERELMIENGVLYFKDKTRPYGFVDLHAAAWFQMFLDADGVEREYLVTEGWLWTGQYPECRRIIEKGNNQSMELDENLTNGSWTKDVNGTPQFFIINEAIISKLCILGENVEPCFEGAQISKVQYSLDENFKTELFSMMKEIKELLSEGGTSMDNQNPVVDPVVEPTPVVDPAPVVDSEPVPAEPIVDPAAEPAVDSEPTVDPEPAPVDPEPAPADPDPAPQYNLEEIPEYVSLRTEYSALQAEYETLQAQHAELVNFKNGIDRAKKQEMINSFSMLSDEDKKDVIDNIDTYSLDEIEAKLSVLCVRNRVNFNLNDDNAPAAPIVYNLNNNIDPESTPAWIKAVQAVEIN